jgi:hypothetical protein
MFKAALLIASLVTILVSCTTPPATPPGTVEPPPATATPMPESSERILRGPGGRQVVLHLWLEVPQKARPGESVPLVLKIQNRNNEPVELFHGFAPFDFLVQREDGTEVWSWLQVIGPIPAALRSTTLQPGQTLDYREAPYTSSAWGQDDDDCTPGPIGGQPCRGNPVPPGKYLVLGTFEAALSDDYARYSQTLPVGPQELVIEP